MSPSFLCRGWYYISLGNREKKQAIGGGDYISPLTIQTEQEEFHEQKISDKAYPNPGHPITIRIKRDWSEADGGLKSLAKGEDVEDRWLSVEEICEYLGVKRDTLYKWISRKDFPAHKAGGRLWKFKKDEVDTWVREGSGNTNSKRR